MSHHKSLSSITLRFSLLMALVACPASRPSPAMAGDPEHGAGAKRVTEIGIKHTPCYGPCPVYAAVIAADGTVRYTGEEHVALKGVRTGKVAREKFDELAKFVLDSGFMGLKDDYSKPITDHAAVITTVVAGGERKAVRDYAGAGPKELAEIERRIDALLAEVKWDAEPAGAATRPAAR